MEYTTLGDTGMEVSHICFSCVSSSTLEWRGWVLDEEAGLGLVDCVIELGINFFDTVNMYPNGEPERVLGKALEGRRDEAVVTSKVYFQMDDDDPNSGGLSRKAIEQKLDNPPDCLGMDALNLLQIHRYDYDIPIGTTMRALDGAARHGKTRYIGTSSMWVHQFAEMQYTADSLGLDHFATVQNHYSLLYCEGERETLPLYERQGVGVMSWSPLAHSYLAHSHRELEAMTRGRTDEHAEGHPYFEDGGREVNERIEELADEKGIRMAQLAPSWMLHKDWADVPIVGTSSIEYLEDTVEALDITLPDSGIDYLKKPYQPVRVPGHD